MKEFTCRVCKKIFYRWASTNAKYCSRKCYLIDKPNTTRKPKIVFICKYCGKKEMRKRNHRCIFCSRKCHHKWMSENQRGENCYNWKGGYVATNGYKYIIKDGKWKTEHRLIMEKALGRKLEKFEIVHHIDGDKLNNTAGNLLAMNNIEHRIYHGLRQSKLYQWR